MKKIMKKVLALTLVLSLVVTSLAACGGEKAPRIAVVAKGESHAFWQAVKSGAESAGEKYGYDITFRGPVSESAKDLPSQKEMVSTALSQEVDGLVLATIGTGFVDSLEQAFKSKIPVVHFDSGVKQEDIDAVNKSKSNPIESLVSTSNLKAASMAADNFFEAIKADIASSTEKYIVGVIQHDTSSTGVDRAKGFMDKFKELADADSTTKGKYEIKLEIKDGDANNSYKTALEALYNGGLNALFMCNEGVVKQVYDAIKSSGDKYDDVVFCGFDAGTKQIDWIKETSGKAVLVGSVAQDSFQIGYQAVEQCVFAIEGKTITPTVEISGAWYDATNIEDMIKKNLVYHG